MIGTGRKACHHKVQQPAETDFHGTTDASQSDALAKQIFNQGPPLVRHEVVLGVSTALAFTRFAQMILCTMAGMAVFLEPC